MNRITAESFSRGCRLALLSTLSLGLWAQTTYDVTRATVLYVSGNDLVVKTEDGLVKHFVVPSDLKFKLDGKEVGIQDLKPGTSLTQTITSTTEEKMVTNVRNVDVKVVEAKSPYLTVSSGNKIRRLKVPEGTTFTINGKQMKLSDLREGMRVKGTVVTSTPTSVVSRSRTVTGQAPKVETPTIIGVLLIEEEVN